MNTMKNILETCSIALSLSAVGAVFLCMLINLYLVKRDAFNVNVNCWFCNTWTKVLYSNRNSFVCSACQQYNGFTEDGGYNKVIEAQHAITSNKTKAAQKTENHSNGLCIYCNNKQQLKVVQLAKFTPLNENNYDIEVEHFRKQLEKAYKLCKKCEVVLRTTIQQKNKWIFGNRLKSLKKKGLSLLDFNKSNCRVTKTVAEQPLFLKCTQYILLFLILCIAIQVFNIRVDYPIKDVKLPSLEMFHAYKWILTDIFSYVHNSTRDINNKIESLNSYLPKYIKLEANAKVVTSFLGFLLQIILLIWDRRPTLWKVNEQLNWTVLITTSVIVINKKYSSNLVTCLQIFSSLMLLYSYLNHKSTNNSGVTYSTKKYEFKKLAKRLEVEEEHSSEDNEEEDEEENQLSTSTSSTKSKKSTFRDLSRSYRASSPIISYPFLNDTTFDAANFRTAQSIPSTTVFERSVQNSDSDLNRSLDNLHLNFGASSPASPVFSFSAVKRPILSPSKLKNITQNPWTAGGFWKHDVNVLSAATSDCNNFSRSSSQSSGFVSCNEVPNQRLGSLPPSRDHSLCGDIERSSILSEPAYHFNPINNSQLKTPPTPQQLYYKADNNAFYPDLRHNSMLFIQSGLEQQPTTSSRLFSDKPVSGLFKNLSGVPGRSDVFRKPLP